MADLSRLPHELVLLIIEEACRTYVRARAAWVASLCLVCKSIQSVVTPILYARLLIYEHNMVALNELLLPYAEPRLSLVREVYFDYGVSSYFDDPVIGEETYDDYATLAHALDGIRVFSGPGHVLEALAYWNPRLRLQLVGVFITDSATVFWNRLEESDRLGMILRSLTYLHLFINLESAEFLPKDLAQLQHCSNAVQFLVFDVLTDVLTPFAAATLDNLIPALSPVVQTVFINIQRLLLRPRCALEENSHRMTAHFAAWAELNRDPRIFVDDVFVPIHDGKRYLYDELDEEDALEGEALWWRGRQLWQGDGH